MKEMKTLTVNGKQYALADGQARQTLDAQAARLAALEDACRVVCQAQGQAVRLTDASNCAPEGLTLYGRTTQAGTPAPETPVELVSAGSGGEIAVNVAGKNRCPINSVESNSLRPLTTIRIPVLAAGTYMFSAVVTKYADDDATKTRCSVTINYTDGTAATYASDYDESSSESDGTARKKSFTFAVSGAKTVDSIVATPLNYGNTGTVHNRRADNIQIEVGSEATDYAPYTGQAVTVAVPGGLPGIPVTSGGNYTDETGQQWVCDEIDLARGVYVQRIGKDPFDGTETLIAYGAFGGGFVYQYVLTDRSAYSAVLCSHYPVAKNHQTRNSVYGGNTVNFNTVFETAAAFKTFLADQHAAGTPVILHYILAKPIETALDADTLAAYAALHTNKPDTTVYSDAGAGLQVSYVADLKAYIDRIMES